MFNHKAEISFGFFFMKWSNNSLHLNINKQSEKNFTLWPGCKQQDSIHFLKSRK